MKIKNLLILIVLGAAVLMLAGCAPGPNPLQDQARGSQHLAGFWLGLWHGMIVPITFIVSLFNKSVGIYETANCGALYNLGFVIGVLGIVGGPAKWVRKKEPEKNPN